MTATKPSPLPSDYTKMVAEVFTANFDGGLKALKKNGHKAEFRVTGNVFTDEVALAISLVIEGQLAATTVHASIDFDPRASSPTVQDLLGLCVDASGTLFGQLLDPKSPARIEQVASQSLGSLEKVPFDWTALELEKRKVYLKIDKSNPDLDRAADDWLEKHDPGHKQRLAEEAQETEKLFVTGKEPRNRGHH